MRIKSVLISILFFMVTVTTLGFTFDVHSPHPEGFFVDLTSIGYSMGKLEISSQPILDILGFYNGNLRYFLRRSSVIQVGGSYYDPFVLPSYFGQPRPQDFSWGAWNVGAYWHNDLNIGRLSLKTHVEVNDTGIGNTTTLSTSTSFNVNATWGKTFGQLGYYTTKNTELFTGIETGKVLNISSNPTPESTEYSQFIEDLKDKSFYVMSKVGFRWFYNDYSAIEIGYRYPVISGFLRFMQGNTLADFFYNYVAVMQYAAEQSGETLDVNIPFITTDYYLSFSAIF